MNIKDLLIRLLRPNGKIDFLFSLSNNVSILDVGCGNNSPFRVKRILNDCTYTGIDISDYNQFSLDKADNYIRSTSDNFSNDIAKFKDEFDVVISSHNLEHCNDRDSTLEAMFHACKGNGKIFLAFPCIESLYFPNRKGTLNYFDDYTHQLLPPNFDELVFKFKNANFEILFSSKNYKPKFLSAIGLILEPISILLNKNLLGTWEYYGFESIIIAKKLSSD